MRPHVKTGVLGIISEQSGIEMSKLYTHSRLEVDFGITGDDICEILEAMDNAFSIDWGNVDFGYYFYPEVTGFLWGIRNRDKVKNIKSFPITVGHLVQIAQAGKWFQPEQVK